MYVVANDCVKILFVSMTSVEKHSLNQTEEVSMRPMRLFGCYFEISLMFLRI